MIAPVRRADLLAGLLYRTPQLVPRTGRARPDPAAAGCLPGLSGPMLPLPLPISAARAHPAPSETDRGFAATTLIFLGPNLGSQPAPNLPSNPIRAR